MSAVFEIPLQVGTPQTFSIQLGGISYQLTFLYRNDTSGLGGWTVDIADSSGNAILQGVPLVTGADLLAQYKHLGFGGALVVQTASNPDAVPTFENLGDDGKIYWIPGVQQPISTTTVTPVQQPSPLPAPQSFTTTLGQTQFNLGGIVTSAARILVVLDGSTLTPTLDYTVVGAVLTLNSATAAGQTLYVTPL